MPMDFPGILGDLPDIPVYLSGIPIEFPSILAIVPIIPEDIPGIVVDFSTFQWISLVFYSISLAFE